MKLSSLAAYLGDDPAFQAASSGLDENKNLVIPRGALPTLLASSLQNASPGEISLVVTASSAKAEALAEELSYYLPGVEVFPAWETLPHELLSPRSDTMALRVRAATRLRHGGSSPLIPPIRVVVASIRTVLQPVRKSLGELPSLSLQVGDQMGMDQLVQTLGEIGYHRADLVTRRGDMAVRGGLVDVFPPTEAHPLRIEFFGDEIDEIRPFRVNDQRGFDDLKESVWIGACREILLDEKTKAIAEKYVQEIPAASEILTLAAQGIYSEGLESLIGILVPDLVPFLDLFDNLKTVFICDPLRVAARAQELDSTTEEFLAAAWSAAGNGSENIPVSAQKASFLSYESVREEAAANGCGCWELAPVRSSVEGETVSEIQEIPVLRGEGAYTIDVLAQQLREGGAAVVFAEGQGTARRLEQICADRDVAARVVEGDLPNPQAGLALVVQAPFTVGYKNSRLTVISEAQLLGRRGQTRGKGKTKLPARRGAQVDPLALKPGEYIVHAHHGIGRFLKLATRVINKGGQDLTREYVVLEYAGHKGRPNDQLWVSTNFLDLLSKYSGSDTPKLSRMGGADWQRTKEKARKAVRDIAAELIRLYAARSATPGYAFSPDTPWQRELEDAFAYVETPDQLVSIDEVKADMEKPIPMDRLICGDVGYGKTEIAVRAAFKAVQDGKQVAVLVPTTLLVAQHLETFRERYSAFPVRVEGLSRFSTAKEAKAVKEGLANGSVEVVIGTHSLITGDVRFKDLGLVIIDEEQRFGVEHKEALKALRTNVDVLAMSATPIPRTLEMALTGIRSMSTLATPPEERHPVLTYVGAASDKQVIAAIKRELLRDGQIFYIHNRVESISKVAARVADLVPEARVRVAHGKMPEAQLEQTVNDFWNHEFDVLVCTTIVENGLDIPNANTLIVDRADMMGLSQLHQLRGRVGRGRERAYAYFFFPPGASLSETALERLKTIGSHTELGAGMAVAQKDLEIRGAGNLLGGEQSGHVAGVGFDLYVQMVAQAVAEFKGEAPVEDKEVKIELPLNAHIPPEYIAAEALRIEAYQRLSATKNESDLEALKAEFEDRYGAMPEALEQLFQIARLRHLAESAGIEEIALRGKYVRFSPVELAGSQQMRLKRLHPHSLVKLATREVAVPAPVYQDGFKVEQLVGDELLEWVRDVITNILIPFAKAD